MYPLTYWALIDLEIVIDCFGGILTTGGRAHWMHLRRMKKFNLSLLLISKRIVFSDIEKVTAESLRQSRLILTLFL